MHSIDELMASFVVWHGEVPLEATPIADWVARAHASPWIRRNIGKGIVQSYVAGYALEGKWWTFFFDREFRAVAGAPQTWRVEAYNNHGPSWSGTFLYWPDESRWRHSRYLACGDNFGRHVLPDQSQATRPLPADACAELNMAADGTSS